MKYNDLHRSTTSLKRLLPLLVVLMAAVVLSYWLTGSTAQAEDQPVSPLICFAASNIPGEGILLAWRSTSEDSSAFSLARAQFTSPLGEIRGPLIPQNNLIRLSERTQEADGDTWHYKQVDRSVADGTKYAYVITATIAISNTQQIVIDEETWTYDANEDTAAHNENICRSDNDDIWTATPSPTPTATPTLFPTDTATPTKTATPTWTHTPTWTATPTATNTHTPLPPYPTKTPYPFPSPTWTWTPSPVPATPTTAPTPTITPTPLPVIGAPTGQPGAQLDSSQPQTPPQPDPSGNTSPLPTATWTPTFTPTAIPAETPTETPTATQPSATNPSLTDVTPTGLQPDLVENSTTPEVRSPVQAQPITEADSMQGTEAAETGEPAEEDRETALSTLVSTTAVEPQVRSEFSPAPVELNRRTPVRVALVAVVGISILTALAFLVGFAALLGGERRHRK